MTCVDPKEAEALVLAGDLESPKFRQHLARCAECARLYEAAGGLARGAAVHPDGSALVSFEEDPASLSGATRDWIRAHLDACETCRDAIRAVPPQGLPLSRKRAPLLPVLAVAGWLLAAVLALFELRPPAPTAKAVLGSQTITISQTRGESVTRVLDVDVLRIECVLGEEVRPGQKLSVRIEDGRGATVLDADAVVDEVSQFGWPVIGVARSALPKGRMTVRVRAPAGSEVAATLEQ
jgi:xanthosine utilization system XapX-like protein